MFQQPRERRSPEPSGPAPSRRVPICSSEPPSSTTERYYRSNASQYAARTRQMDLSPLRARFLADLRPGGRILDAGSGSGRDTLAFLRAGYTVEAFDGCADLAAESTRLTGIRTQVLRFQSLPVRAWTERFDGLWASASLLHLTRSELPDALSGLAAALLPGGVLYASFRYGAGARTAIDGRFFTDLDEALAEQLLLQVDELTLVETWVNEGAADREGRSDWLNLLARKVLPR